MTYVPHTRKLLDAVTATGASAWVGIWPYDDITLHIYGMVTNDIVIVEGSNEDGDPANGAQIGANVTSDSIREVAETPRKLRVNFTDNSGGGTVTVILEGRIPG